MKRFLATIFLALIATTMAVAAKGATTVIRITGAELQGAVEIRDPGVLEKFNVWSGPGTFVNDVEATEGFIVDWTSGVVTDRPNLLRNFELAFYVKYANRPAAEQQDELAYVVSYSIDPGTGQGYVYLPGRADEPYRLNTQTIHRGREGQWFRATTAWQSAFNSVVPR